MSGRTANELPGLVAARQLILFSLDSMGLGRRVQVGRRFQSIYRRISPFSVKELWLTVEEVVHHDDVMAAIVIRSRGNVAGRDLDGCDARILKHDAEEGQTTIARRGRDETAEYQFAVPIEVLDQRAGAAVSALRARAAAIWLVNVCKDRAEASDCCRGSAIGTRYGEGRFGDVAPHRSEQPRRAERPEDFGIARIAKKHRQSALESARRRSLRKPQSGCFELAASGVQEHEERIYWGCRIQKLGVATVPVDLAPTLLERAWIIAVVVPQHSAECIDCALNGRSIWSGSLEYERRPLCVSSLAHGK